MISFSKIAGLIKAMMNLWKQCINMFDFLHGDIYQGKVAYEATTCGWMYPGMPSHTQTCLDFPGIP